jgi:uncharacterized protein YcgI (DUF1989 family)
MANVNFFVKVVADHEGNLQWVEQRHPGGVVELRAELNTLVLLSNTPHPLDPNPRYEPGPVQLMVWAGEPAGKDDPCRMTRPENARGFTLTEAYFA